MARREYDVPRTRSLEFLSTTSGCARIVTLGHQVLHEGYLSVARMMLKAREAGAEMRVEAERGRTAEVRGVVGV